jgi:ornithine cyclodeaminase
MREADDELMRRATIWLDNPAARHESGDIALPLQHGALTADRILGTLQDLLLGTCPSRTSPEQITVFKSVGFALEDLALASWLAHQVEAST